MRTSLALLALAACAAVALAAVPEQFRHVGEVPDHFRVPLLVAVKHPNVKLLEAACNSVSDPDSSSYGHFLDIEELKELLATEERSQRVAAWLTSEGASNAHIVKTGDFVRAEMSVADVERVFNVDMVAFETDVIGKSGQAERVVLARSGDEYVVPEAVSGIVDMVFGVNSFPVLQHAPRGAMARATRAVERMETPPGDGPMPALVIITDKSLWAIVTGACPTAPTVGYTFRLTPFGGSPVDVHVPSGSPAFRQGLPGTCLAILEGVVKPFEFYNITVRAELNETSHTEFQGLPFQWSTMPEGWRGVAATPGFTPAYTRTFYGLPNVTVDASATPATTQAVAEFVNQFYTPADLTAYMNYYGLPNDTKVTLVGPNMPASPGLEAQMDIELLMQVAPSVPTYFWSVALPKSFNFTGAWMLEWATQMSDATDIPDVTSISYGLPEIDAPGHLPGIPGGNDYYQRTNEEFMKLCARGSSVIVCSQDAGATADGHGAANCTLKPEYPASSPWVTTVGSTVPSMDAPNRPNIDIGEAAVSPMDGTVWTSGGGFSKMQANMQPEYQAEAVSTYLKTAKNLPHGLFNESGRAYPDVAMVGSNWWINFHGVMSPIGDGTSSSTPVFSGVVTLLNEARASVGKPPLGFLNPLLYKLAVVEPAVFYDCTVGGNRCGEYVCCPNGYETAVGFDAVTGLGSIGDFEALKQTAMSA